MECGICSEKFNKTTRKPIECESCKHICCRSCATKYMQSLHVDMHCMNCKEEWGRGFMIENFTKVFIGREYKNHLRDIYLEREISTITACVSYLESENKISSSRKEIGNNMELIRSLYLRNDELRNSINHEQTLMENFLNSRSSDSSEIEKIVINGRCQVDGCNGFITDKWSCSTCHTKICQTCMEQKNDNHECNPSIKESVSFIKNDTKPCPSCSIRVHRIEGCYQMWCTNCNTAFDWTHGTIIKNTQNFHNPHYTEYVQRNPNTSESLYARISRSTHVSRYAKEEIIEHVRQIYHVLDCIDEKKMMMSSNRSIKMLKIKYLKNEITKDELRLRIEKEYTSNSLDQHICDVVSEYSNKILEFTEKYIKGEASSNNYRALIMELGHPYFEQFSNILLLFGKEKSINGYDNIEQIIFSSKPIFFKG